FTARVAALHAKPRGVYLVDPLHAQSFLAGQSIDLLPASSDVVARLRMFGLETLGSLAALSKHSVTAEFGPEGQQMWLLSRGDDPEPLRPRNPADSLREQ